MFWKDGFAEFIDVKSPWICEYIKVWTARVHFSLSPLSGPPTPPKRAARADDEVNEHFSPRDPFTAQRNNAAVLDTYDLLLQLIHHGNNNFANQPVGQLSVFPLINFNLYKFLFIPFKGKDKQDKRYI